MESIDNEARDRIAELDKLLAELAVDYWGMNRDNGRRSEIADLWMEHKKLSAQCKEYIYKTRAETCLGLKALEKSKGDEDEMKTEKIKANGQVTATLITQICTLLGIIALAVLK